MTDRDPTDVDRILGALRGPAPPDAPPALPDERPLWRRPVLALAAAVLLGIGIGTLGNPEPEPLATRGATAAAPTAVELRVVVDADGTAQRINRTTAYPVGQLVFFGIAAEPQADVTLWVKGPSGSESLAKLATGPTLHTLPTAFALDQPGAWTFHLTTGNLGQCPPESCDRVTVTVR